MGVFDGGIFKLLTEEVGSFDPPRYAVGGDAVASVLGRKVRLSESFRPHFKSHVGHSPSYQLGFNGDVYALIGTSLGEAEHEDIGVSVTGSTSTYPEAQHFTPIDIAMYKDIGYPVAPLNASFFYDPQGVEIGYNLTDANTIYLPFLRVGSELLSSHLSSEPPPTGEKLTRWQLDANDYLNSPEASFDASTGIMTIPNLEIYQNEGVSHYSIKLSAVADTFPVRFELQEVTPLTDAGIESSVTIVHCE